MVEYYYHVLVEQNLKQLGIYVHGKGGNALEAEHYKLLFSESDVIGFDYYSEYPWDAKKEFSEYYDCISKGYDSVILIANSIGAFFSMSSLADKNIAKAMLISPIVDMEKLITNMMMWANVTETQLQEKQEIPTAFGETLSWKYLCFVRENRIKWNIPTCILYGENDNLASFDTISEFGDKINALVTVMENGEHWFHTDEQMQFLDKWILNNL